MDNLNSFARPLAAASTSPPDCKAVLAGQAVNTYINEEEDETYYQKHLDYLRANHRPTHYTDVIQSRREVIQHAQAFQYTTSHIVTHREPLSEPLILEVHSILHADLDSDVTPGQYRTHDVTVRFEKPSKKSQRVHVLMYPRAVPAFMKDVVDHLNQESAAAEVEGGEGVDPYVMTARFHYVFLCSHPFGNGNRRMSRIILNALLLRYAGCVSVFGATQEERDEYIGIAKQNSRAFRNEDKGVELGQKTGHLMLVDFLRAKSDGSTGQVGWVVVVVRKNRGTPY